MVLQHELRVWLGTVHFGNWHIDWRSDNSRDRTPIRKKAIWGEEDGHSESKVMVEETHYGDKE